MIVVQSGPQRVGSWVEEERNVYEDYQLAFGEEPPAISGVAIMSDTDNTKERAVAYYGDIVFVQGLEVKGRWSGSRRGGRPVQGRPPQDTGELMWVRRVRGLLN